METHIKLSKEVKFILNELNKYGNGYIVGGAVRDHLMGKNPDDYDFATNINYSRLKNIFINYYPREIGKSFGILLIKMNNEKFEIAKFRKDIGIENGRHPQKVEFVEDVKVDLARRDFTINAMGYNNLGLVDPFNGKMDIESKLIKFVGDPQIRIDEDALRILRAFRFMSKLGFTLEEKTKEAIKIKKMNLKKISTERIMTEFSKIILGPHVYETLNSMKELGVLEIIIPEIRDTYNFDQKNPHHSKDLFEHIVEVVSKTKNDLVTRLAALFHDLGKVKAQTIDDNGIAHYYGHENISADIAKNRLLELKFSQNIIHSVLEIISKHMIIHQEPSVKTIKKMISTMGERNIERLFDHLKADLESKTDKPDYTKYIELETKFKDIFDSGAAIHMNQMDITGIDLQNFQIYDRAIGEIKQKMYNEILNDKLENKKLSMLKYLMREYNLDDNKIEYEKSCGAVIYRINENKEIEYLIVKIPGGNWGFPKGHVEGSETEIETAIREVKEETFISINILDGYREVISYIPRRFIYKEVIYFLAEAITTDVKVDGIEISEYKWGNLKETMKTLTYKLQRDILLKAHNILINKK